MSIKDYRQNFTKFELGKIFRYHNNSVVFYFFAFEFDDEDILGNLQRRLRESFLII